MPKAPAIVSKWQKFFAIGCVHGDLACPVAQRSVLDIVERWKPDVRLDLGDLMDLAAFRGGAKGSADESRDIGRDFNAGAEWLRRYRPTHRCFGNHDHRIAQLASHPNAIVAHCAGKVLEDIRQIDEKNKTEVRPYHMRDGWFQFGDMRAAHGWMFNEMAIRDHAETFAPYGGKVIHAHIHTPGMATGRCSGSPQGFSVGTLGDPDNFDYAMSRRAWLRWAHGAVFGEFNDKFASVYLISQQCNHGQPEEWKAPI